VLVATTLGAVAGPNLTDAMGSVADAVGLPVLAGRSCSPRRRGRRPGLVLLVFLRPDPLLTAPAPWRLDRPPVAAPLGGRAATATGVVPPRASAMILSQLVMTAGDDDDADPHARPRHGLGATGVVIAIHIGCMYLPSPLTGVLVDRIGRRPVIGAGGVVLLAAGLVAASAPTDSVAVLALALGLLGLGLEPRPDRRHRAGHRRHGAGRPRKDPGLGRRRGRARRRRRGHLERRGRRREQLRRARARHGRHRAGHGAGAAARAVRAPQPARAPGQERQVRVDSMTCCRP
jgi:hypothetical protein